MNEDYTAMSMATNPLFQKLGERIDMEKVLLLLMFFSAVYMIWESFTFDISQAATFPRLTAGFVIFGTLLLFLRPVLPEPFYSFVAKDSQIVGVDDEFESGAADEETDEGESASETAEESSDLQSSVDRPLPDPVFTALSAIGYGVFGYVAGILWITPLFVVAYGLWFRVPKRVIVVLVVIAFLLAFGFMEALNAPIDRGEIINQGGI